MGVLRAEGTLGGLEQDGGSHVAVGRDTQAEGTLQSLGCWGHSKEGGIRDEHLEGGLWSQSHWQSGSVPEEGASLVDTWWPQTTSSEFVGVENETREQVQNLVHAKDLGRRCQRDSVCLCNQTQGQLVGRRALLSQPPSRLLSGASCASQ